MQDILYVPKGKEYKEGYYLWVPRWDSYDIRPKRISAFMYNVLALLPWYSTNPFNGYLVKKNKWTNVDDFSDFVYNPHEKTDSLLKEELGFTS